MRILLLMDPGIPVPPPHYGGHERLVAMFADEYTRLGHEVTLLAGPESIASTVYHFGKNGVDRTRYQTTLELLQAWSFLKKNKSSFDFIHNFGRSLYLIPVLNSPIYKIMTYGRPVTRGVIRLLTAFPHKKLIFTACSNYCVSTGNIAGNWKTVYNSIDFSKYMVKATIESDAPLMFLGRLDQIKGAHTAIKVAKATNHRLLIGGNISHTPDNYRYYKDVLEPEIDGEQIVYLGPLDDVQKNHYLGQSKALLFPIEWDEPFGMVMVEAMACGTPVIAMARGSVNEVVSDMVTGIKVGSINEMVAAVENVKLIDRTNCRQASESRFDVKVITQEYLALLRLSDE